MPNQQFEPAIAQGAFRALADPTRRDILMRLGQRDMTIGEIADNYPVTRAAIKKHLTILQEGHLISVHPAGRERINRLQPLALKSAYDWLGHFDQFWDDKLSALKTAVEADADSNKPETNEDN